MYNKNKKPFVVSDCEAIVRVRRSLGEALAKPGSNHIFYNLPLDTKLYELLLGANGQLFKNYYA